MADVESNINVNIDTSSALASIKRLQAQISTFHQQMAKGGAAAAASSAQLQQGLVNSINSTGNFSASMTRIRSATESFTNSLEKNKLSMGEYFRYAGASTKTFGRLFSSEFNTIDKVARERVKDLQTQYIKLGRDASGAMQSIAVRPLTLDMNDLGTKTAMAAQKQQLFNQLMKQGSTNLLNFGKNTQWAGRQLMVGFTIPLGIMGAAAAREFKNIEEQVIRLERVYGDFNTTMADTEQATAQIKALAEEFTKYGVAVSKTIGLAADVAAMGLVGNDLIAQVAEATRLATLGSVEQAQALEATISMTSAFGVATEDLAKKTDFLNAVENQTLTSIEDLTTAIPKAGPVIQQLGGNVEDLTFFLTAMREGGINASESANALKSGLASLINPTEEASKMLGGFGINLQGIVEANKGNVKGIVIDFAKALDTLDPLNRAQAIEQLFGKFQFSRLSTLFQNVIKEGGQASRVLELTQTSAAELALLSERELGKVAASPLFKFEGAVERLKSSLAPVGEAFLKAITPIIEWGSKVLEWFNSWNEQAKNIGVVLTIAIAGIGPVLLMAFGLIANGAANIIKMFMGLRNMFLRAGGGSKILGEQLNYMTQEQLQAATVAASLDQAHNKLRQTFTSEASAVGQLIAQYQAATAAQNRFMAAPANRGKGRPPVKKAGGGIVYGPGTGTSDSIPAMLSNGEAVIPAAEVRKNPGLIRGLIAGKIQGFSKGTPGAAAGKSAVVAFGAHQPFTIAHESIAMMGQEMAKSVGAEFIQATSAGSKEKRSILTQQERSSMIEESIGQKPMVAKDPFDLMKKLAANNIEEVKLLVGQDRAESKVWMQAAEAAKIKLETVSVPRPEGSVSGTAARAAAASGDYPAFKGMLASGVSDATAQSVFGRFGGPSQVAPTTKLGGGLQVNVPGNTELAHFSDLETQTGQQLLDWAKTADITPVKRKNVEDMVSSSEKGIDSLFKVFDSRVELLSANFNQKIGEAGSGKTVTMAETRKELVDSGDVARAPIRTVMQEMGVSREKALEKARLITLEVEKQLNALGNEVLLTAENINEITQKAYTVVSETDDDVKQALARMESERVIADPNSARGTKKQRENITSKTYRSRGDKIRQVAEVRKSAMKLSPEISAQLGIDERAVQTIFKSLGDDVKLALYDLQGDVKLFAAKLKEEAALAGISLVQPTESVKAAKAAGAKAVKEQKDAFNKGAKEEGGVASPAKVPKKVGAAHSEGFTEGAKEGIAKAKSAGTKIADRVVNNNPAFGRVPQMPPVATVGMQKFISERSAKMNRSVIEAQLSQMGGMKILTATEVKLRDATKMLAGSKLPLEGLTRAAQKTKTGLASAAISVRDFSTNAATRLSDSIKGIALRTKEAAINIGNSAKQIALSAGQGIAGAPGKIGEKIKGNRQRFAGAGMGASMGLMMASSMMPAEAGAAGSIVGGTAMGASMGMMFGPWGAGIGAALGLVSSSAMAVKEAFDSAQRSAEAFAKTTGASSTAIEALATASGNVSASEEMDKRRSEALSNVKRTDETNAVAASYLGSETGKASLASLGESKAKSGTAAGIENITAQMSTAIAEGAISRVDARAIVEDMGVQLGDKTFALRVNAKVDSLVGPNGEDLEKDPVKVRLAIVKESGKQIGRAATTVANTNFGSGPNYGASVAGGAAAGAALGAVGGSIFAGIGAVPGAIIGGTIGAATAATIELVDYMGNLGSASAVFASNVTAAASQSQAMLDSLQLEYEKRIEVAKAAGDTAEADRLAAEYQKGRTDILAQSEKNKTKAANSYMNADGMMKTATIGSLDQQIKDTYEGTPQQAAAQGAIDKLGGSTGVGGQAEFILKAELGAGTLTATTLDSILALYKNEGADASILADLVVSLGGAEADRVMAFANMAGSEQQTIDFVASFEELNPEVAENILDTITTIGEVAGADAMTVAVDLQASDPAKFKALQTNIKKIDDLFADGQKKTYEQILEQRVLDEAQTKFLRENAEWFDGLPALSQKFAIDYMVTVTAEMDDSKVADWMNEKNAASNAGRKGRGVRSGKTAETVTQADRDAYIAGSVISATAAAAAASANLDAGDDPGDRSGGGGGGRSEEPPPRNISDVIADQQQRITAINDQTTAVRKLVAAGLSLADAYAIASNAEDAALIAHGATAAQLADLTAKTREAEKATKDLAAAQNVANSAMDTKEKNDLATRLAADSSLTDIQKRFLLENPDAGRLYMTPEVDEAALKQALLDAQNAGTYEFNINRVTIPGLQSIWEKGMSNAAEAFSAQENAIKINFDIQRSPFEDIIQAGQRAIADIQNRAGGLDDLDADLQRIANKEFEINKAYDEKIKALDEVAKINDKIIAQQKSQLGLADALSRGDIAGAAKAAQDMRAQASAGSIAEQRSMLDESRKLEVEGLTGTGGLTREQIEEKIRDLKAQILEIEEKRIEPAQRQMELLERMQQDQIDALTVLGKTREEWDGINASLELANTKTKEFQDAMREALTIATTLGTALATGVVPTVGSMPVPAKPPAPAAPARTPYSYPGQVSSGSRGDTVSKLQSALNVGGAGLAVDGQFGPKTRQAVVNFQSSQGLAADGIAGPLTWKKLYDVQYFKKGGKVAYMKKGGKMSYMKKGGLMSYMNAGGMVPYMAMGGIANMLAKGTDTIPAMLTAGEFVMSKPAVDKIGVGRLAQLNRGYDRNTNNKSDSVYNYSISVNASTNANPREIANTVLDQIKQIDQQRVRGNRFNYAQ